jgi:hypothetical protein
MPMSVPYLESERTGEGATTMLWTVAVVLLVLWFLGLVTSVTLHGLIHLLLALAIIAVLVLVVSGQNAV